MRKHFWLGLVVAAFVLGTVTGAYFFGGADKPRWKASPAAKVTKLPRINTASKAVASRCTQKLATQVRLVQGDATQWEKSTEEIIKLPGSIVVNSGRHKGERGLPLAALLPKDGTIKMMELVPCRGEPRRFMAAELSAKPDQYVLVLNQRKTFKLVMRTEKGYGRKPLARNVAFIRLLP